jgi:hypothetical protein
MEVIMKQTVAFISVLANSGDKEAIDKINTLSGLKVIDRGTYYIIQEENHE